MFKKYRCNFEELEHLKVHNGQRRNCGVYIVVSAKMTDLLQSIICGFDKAHETVKFPTDGVVP